MLRGLVNHLLIPVINANKILYFGQLFSQNISYHFLARNTKEVRAVPKITVTITTKSSSTGVLTDAWTLEDVNPMRKSSEFLPPPFPDLGSSASNSSFGRQVNSTKVQVPFCKQWLSFVVERFPNNGTFYIMNHATLYRTRCIIKRVPCPYAFFGIF